jgi:hypothetical protein
MAYRRSASRTRNNLSLVTFVKCGHHKIIFPGDMETEGWRRLLQNPEFVHELNGVNLFVASHHGRENGYCEEVLDLCPNIRGVHHFRQEERASNAGDSGPLSPICEWLSLRPGYPQSSDYAPRLIDAIPAAAVRNRCGLPRLGRGVNRAFDFYEYAGVIVPGAVFTLGLLWLLPDSRALFSKEGVTFGELGLFIIIAYAAGQFIQGIGNWIEWLWWKPWGGYPSRRVLAGHLISADQHERVIEALRRDAKVRTDVTTCALPECLAIVREVYSVVAAAGKAGRVDIFNGNYGLSRGLAASLLVLLLAAIVLIKGLYVIGALVALLFLALQRMHRFGTHYALELFIQYVLVSAKPAEQ